MPNEYPMNDPRSVWQNQPTEPLKMSTDEMRRRAQQLRTNARGRALFLITTGLAFCVIFAMTFAMAHGILARIGWALASLWGIYVAYQAYLWIWPRNLPEDAPAGTCLEFYRRELERQRDYARHVWLRSGLPVVLLAIAFAVVGTGARRAPPTPLRNAAPFLVALAIWVVGFFLMRKREKEKEKLGRQMDLQQEIDELRAYERERR